MHLGSTRRFNLEAYNQFFPEQVARDGTTRGFSIPIQHLELLEVIRSQIRCPPLLQGAPYVNDPTFEANSFIYRECHMPFLIKVAHLHTDGEVPELQVIKGVLDG